MSTLQKICLLTGLLIGSNLRASFYDEATAKDPRYEDKTIWPTLTGKEYFIEETYPEGRVMTWAHPGKSVGGRGGLDAWDPENWLLNGEPAAEVRFDETTDLVLPDSATPYKLDLLRTEGWDPVYRHVTIGKNAELLQERARYFGNIWVKKGGTMNSRHSNNYSGDKHTFVREDNGTWEDPKSGRIGQYFILTKSSPETSLEIIGNVSVLDRMPLEKGMLIVSADCRISPGRNANLILSKNATLVLLDGARFGKWVNQIGQIDGVVFGKLQGGLPERPLTRPAYFELSYQNTTEVLIFENFDPPSQGGKLEERISSIIFAKGSEIISISAEPRGVLYVRWNGINAKDWHLTGDAAYRNWLQSLSDKHRKEFADNLDEIPKKITAIFQPGVKVDGVALDQFHAGGLLMEDPEDFKQWKRVYLGPESTTRDPITLITPIARASVDSSPKSQGGSYQIGIPKPFASKEFDTQSAWKTEKLTFTVPQEAKGYSIGFWIFNSSKINWCNFDNASFKVDGKQWIENGEVNEPNIEIKSGRLLGLGFIRSWQAMGSSTSNLGVTEQDGNRYIKCYSPETRFGQTTAYIAKGGEKLEVDFDIKTDGGASVTVEAYYLEL